MGVATRVVEDNLQTTDTSHNVIPEMQSSRPQPSDFGGEIRNPHLDAIPTTRDRLTSIWQRRRP